MSSFFLHKILLGDVSMRLWKPIEDYIEDREFHFDVFDDRIHVVNYLEILSVGDEKIIILGPHQKIYLYGSSFSLSKLFDQELLIDGKLLKVEVTYE